MIATNAKKIVDLRANGYKPDEMVIVSLVGKQDELNHVVYADPKQEYDWRWCAGLQICVFASSAVKWMETVKAIAGAKPAYLALWDVDRKEGAEFSFRLNPGPVDKPASHWQTRLEADPWIPMQNRMFEESQCS